MKFCPTCKTQYPEDANFCPQETCATPEGPQRLQAVAARPPARFQPIEKIGGGNTGDVWRATDSQTGNEIAYKVVAAEVVPTPAVLARAEREFKQLTRVSSPKIATIIECEKNAAGGLGVAMELCPGDSLDRILAAGPVPFDQAKSIVSQVGLALLEAQKVGLVHRDVAPKNILVSASGEVKVINFPLAKPINDRVAGVAAYLSPEQAQGKPVDQRSNTYSLAAIFYHLLTGEAPFQALTPQAVLDMHVSTPVLPPTQRRPGANLPADADKLIVKALDKSSSRRHLTLRLFLNELDALKEKPVGAAKPAGEAALAKTMMFGGNQADIARMVAEARAAKAAAAPAPAVVAVPAAHAPHVPQQPAPIEIGQTIAAGGMPAHATPQAQPLAARVPPQQQPAPFAPPAQQVPAQYQATPAPRPPTPAPVPKPQAVPGPAQPAAARPVQPAQAQPATPAAIKPHEAGKAAPPKGGAAFRETLWFKHGDVEQMVADAKAKLQAAGKPAAEAAALPEDTRPLEDRYVDDGSVTVEDRKKFSLRTGGTATAMPVAGPAVPGEKMDESEMVEEISSGRRTMILVIAAVVILALIVVIAMMMKGKSKSGAALPTTETAGQLAAAAPAPPAAGKTNNPVGQLALDAGVPPGSPAIPGLPSPGKPTGAALGAAGGATNPSVGGATGDAKPAAAAAKKPAKKKPAAKRPAKHKQH
jgi:eukaryotic-like serine/threonine-protein kinase